MLKAMTYNIRYDTPRDGENRWELRKEHLAKFVEEKSPDVLGLQESLLSQVSVMEELLPTYSHVGVGRDDGVAKGEFTPVFYKKDKFKIVKTGVFWLSETPDIIGSVGWDAALPRIATWVILENKSNFEQYFVLNTHFDHRGEQARVNSAKLIVENVKALAGNLPIVIMGDFNATADSEVYQTMVANSGLSASKSISTTSPKGREGTFNGFKIEHGEYRIDYIFVNKRIKVKSYEVATPKYNGRQVSDHYPVCVELEILN